MASEVFTYNLCDIVCLLICNTDRDVYVNYNKKFIANKEAYALKITYAKQNQACSHLNLKNNYKIGGLLFLPIPTLLYFR